MGKMKELVIEVCQLYDSGKEVYQIADELRISRGGIHRILDMYYVDYLNKGL